MADNCCQLVGNLQLDFGGCLISVNTSCSTEIMNVCGPDNLLEGATIETVSIAAYASDTVHIGCPAKAGVTINWIRKYDCEKNITYFIFSGEGESYVAGNLGGVAFVHFVANSYCLALSASSSSGPAAVYMQTEQTNGYGLSYLGEPISFSTDKSGTIMYFNDNTYYLQNFSYDAQPGQLPVANYSLTRSIET